MKRGNFSKFALIQKIPNTSGGASFNNSGSNFYINPKEVLDFITDHDELFDQNGDLVLSRVRELFNDILDGSDSVIEFWNGTRDDSFVENEYRKMHIPSSAIPDANWIFPHNSNGVLYIPTRDVFDLPVYMMLYILEKLTDFPDGRRSFSVMYTLDEDANATAYPIYDDDNHPVSVINGRISMDDLHAIYMKVIREFAALLPEGDATWNGSEESGTRIIIANYLGDDLKFNLVFVPVGSVSYATGWTQQVEDLLAKNVNNSVLSVRNRKDNKCLIYCLIMGL